MHMVERGGRTAAASAMPSEPQNSAVQRRAMPGDASTMPTIAVNTISRLTLGLVSSRKSRQRPRCGRWRRWQGYRGRSTLAKGTMASEGAGQGRATGSRSPAPAAPRRHCVKSPAAAARPNAPRRCRSIAARPPRAAAIRRPARSRAVFARIRVSNARPISTRAGDERRPIDASSGSRHGPDGPARPLRN